MQGDSVLKTFTGRDDIPKRLHPVCKACIRNAREKYTGFTSDDGTHYKDGFRVPCTYIPHDEEFYPKSLKKTIPPDDWAEINSLKSPLHWGEANLLNPDNGQPWKAWEYQRGPLLCPSARMVLRFGRRCMPGDQPVLLDTGRWIPLREVEPGQKVISLTEDFGQRVSKVLDHWANGIKTVYEIRLTNGMSVKATGNHPFFAHEGNQSDSKWTSIESGLHPGMQIAVLGRYDVWGEKSEGTLARDLDSIKSTDKNLPDWFFDYDKDSQLAYINRLFSNEGSIRAWIPPTQNGETRFEISLASTSRNFLDQIRLILMKIGVVSVLQRDSSEDLPSWKLCITKERDASRFFREVGFPFQTETQCQELLDSFTSRGEISDVVEFASIESITKVGEEETFDIEVEGTHNFVSNGVYSHNTGKTTLLSVFILWYLFTSAGGTIRDPETNKIRKNLRVLLITPQKAHIENIFDRIRSFIQLSPALSTCIHRNKRGSPQFISLRGEGENEAGNAVSGFASGDSSGSKGLSTRGQDADLVVMDEGAFVSRGVVENVINPILYTRTTTRFVVSSTPSGVPNDYFESLCTARPDFAEFYVPATRHPKWPEMEEQVKKDFASSKEQWDKEVKAKFSPAGIGVYKGELVKLGQSEFEYGDIHRGNKPDLIYTIGVDWNKEHGTEIAIVGTEKKDPCMSYTTWAENISKKDFTTPSGIGRIVELNRIWQPSWIYVDDGGGDGGEMLRYHGRAMAGKNQLDARLMNIIEVFNFSSKIEFQDHSGKKVKAIAKQFMVENSVRRFEIGCLKYPMSDLVLTKQLENYIIVRRTPAGNPVYGMKEDKWGDHRLDALNLALVAVRLKYPSLFNEPLSPLGLPISFIPEKDNVPSAQRTLVPQVVRSPHQEPGGHSRDWRVRKNIGNTNSGWGREEAQRGPANYMNRKASRNRFGR